MTPTLLQTSIKSSLASAIRLAGVAPTEIPVLYASVSAECANFAADTGEAIEKASIRSPVYDGVMYTSNPSERGIKIVHGKGGVITKLAAVIERELRDLGFIPERRAAEERDRLFLYIAPRSD